MPRKKSRNASFRRRRVRYGLLPVTALLICLPVLVLIRTGAAQRLESAIAAAAQNRQIAETLLQLVLPVSVTHAAVQLQPEAPADEPAPSVTQLPQTEVFESILPQLPLQDSPVREDSAVSLTIDGSSGDYQSSGTVYLRNETDYTVDVPALLQKPSPVRLSGDGVQVLIVHTHGTEAYTPDDTHRYTPTDTDRTTDSQYNMLRVGKEIANILTARGIKTVQSQTLNDYPAYSGSYNRALADISALMKQYPSVKVVIDVHRDAMIAADGTRYKTVADINGKKAAQLMFVTGTDAGGLSHANWQENLTFQLKLQQRLNSRYPGIMRPMNIRTGRFNQHVTTGSMLLEVGTCGNTLAEALYSAQLFANTLADLLLEQ